MLQPWRAPAGGHGRAAGAQPAAGRLSGSDQPACGHGVELGHVWTEGDGDRAGGLAAR